MRPLEVVTVTDARSQLSQLLSKLDERGLDAEPVFIGAHRKATGVLLSVEAYEELTSIRERFYRQEAVASAWGSLSAEGLAPTAEFLKDAKEFADGVVDSDELARRAIARHQR